MLLHLELSCHFSERVSQSCSWYGEVEIREIHLLQFLSVVGWPLMPNCCRGSGLLLHLITFRDTHTHTNTREDSSGPGIGPSQRPVPDSTQHLKQADIHAFGGIRTRNPSRRVAADPCNRAATGIGTCFLTFVFAKLSDCVVFRLRTPLHLLWLWCTERNDCYVVKDEIKRLCGMKLLRSILIFNLILLGVKISLEECGS
jgi:hypothetical protein